LGFSWLWSWLCSLGCGAAFSTTAGLWRLCGSSCGIWWAASSRAAGLRGRRDVALVGTAPRTSSTRPGGGSRRSRIHVNTQQIKNTGQTYVLSRPATPRVGERAQGGGGRIPLRWRLTAWPGYTRWSLTPAPSGSRLHTKRRGEKRRGDRRRSVVERSRLEAVRLT